jgi:hypothetical protein
MSCDLFILVITGVPGVQPERFAEGLEPGIQLEEENTYIIASGN